MPSRTTHRIALGATTLAVLLAGCGGDDTLSARQLTEQANTICAKYAVKGKELGSPDLNDPKVAQTYFSKAADLATDQQDELEALKPGEKQSADFNKLINASDDATQLLDDLADAAGGTNRDALTGLLTKLGPISKEVNEASNALGATSCAAAQSN